MTNGWSMMPGQALGPWRIVEPLGMGSFAEVYKAQHHLTARRLAAIKVLRPTRLESTEARRRFLQEADCLSEIDSPNVVKFYDADLTADGRVWMAMEYLVGQSLYDLLARSGPLDLSRALSIAADVAHGVQAAHVIGLIHRDLKEENIFITSGGTVKVLDFGVAKLKNPELSSRAKSTVANTIIGTLTHLAPEQLDGGRTSAESDVYALGVILYTLITGRHPYLRGGEEHEDATNIALRILVSSPVPPRSLAPQITPEIEFLLYTALAKRPENRYRSMTEFQHAIVLAWHNYDHKIYPPGFTSAAIERAIANASSRLGLGLGAPAEQAPAAPTASGSYAHVAKAEAPRARATPSGSPLWFRALTILTALTVAAAVALFLRPDWVAELRQALHLIPTPAIEATSAEASTSPAAASAAVSGAAAAALGPQGVDVAAKPEATAAAAAPSVAVDAAKQVMDGKGKAPTTTTKTGPDNVEPTVPKELAKAQPSGARAPAPTTKTTTRPPAAASSPSRPSSGIVDPWANPLPF